MQLPMFAPESSWRPPSIDSLPSWKGMKRISIDCETKDPFLKKLGPSVRRGGYITGISLTFEDTNQSFYLPYRHLGGDNLPVEEVLRYMKMNAAEYEGQIVGANLSYDLDYLWTEGILFPKVSFYRDIQIAAPLIYELEYSYSLFNIGQRVGIEAKEDALLNEAAAAYGLSPKSDMWQLPARYVGLYAETDTITPLQILRKQEAEIERLGLWDIWNLESKVLPILVKMRQRGVLIDQDQLEHVENWSLEQEAMNLKIVKDATGHEVGIGNVWKAQALVPALEFIGVKLGKTKTGKPQINKETLESINHPVAKALARARKVNKVRTTFAQSIRNYMVDGRIHCTLKQMASEDEEGNQKGARYGRLSCIDPNLQQQPSRDDFANMWRDIYIPEKGKIWGCLDYSQQEPRWTTHFADIMGLTKADQAAKRYRDDPSTDNHDMMTRLIHGDEAVSAMDKIKYKASRSACKDIFLGLCYGEGGAKLATDLGLSTRWSVAFGRGRKREVKFYENRADAMEAKYNYEGSDVYMWEAAGAEAQGMLDNFDANCPYVRQLAKAAEDRAKDKGHIITVGGRRLNFEEQKNGTYDYTHKALNRVIQGSSADQMKTAMVMIEEQMPETFIQLQVHDELDGSFESIDEMKRVAKIMSECIGDTRVPFKVDIEIGPSWGSLTDAE